MKLPSRRKQSSMTARQCEIAAEAYTACLLAQCGYDVLVQYGANQPYYDLVADKNDEPLKRHLYISVKGSQDGGWMLAVRYLRVCQTNCVTEFHHSAASGTRSSPNISWKLCSAGFQ